MHLPGRAPRAAPTTVPTAARASAVEVAARAATRAGVRIRLAEDLVTVEAVSRFLAGVWQTPEHQPPLGVDALRAFAHAGGAVHYSSDGDEVIAASVLLFCRPASRAVYSMIAAARTSDRGVGFALKQAQRVWALDHGATSMIWTFDPLVSRNAHFNLAKLGATAGEYRVNFFGHIDDGVNGHDETDRLTAVWSLAEPRPDHVVGPDFGSAEVDAARAPDGRALSARDENGHWCRVPADIVATRREDRELAAAWREAVRGVLLPAFDAGFTVTGFSRAGWYRLTRTEQP
ncbi:hypothetical protein [Amycolatopsis sp. BJA-103]|uniref:hypothetical protein n=1 Tax=Amycolatopsis sp. BJA-103 TaxID=1911175 RepID=UPI000C7694E9|nr:hypothetical protein [Amycolatopsis sp. BJA-103]AUI58628.1 hypothetical protein BKN51_10685 [Amycolatopsis sp. BJA-103]PNE15048.1 hypothetical protein B1H26_32680 [Amycolatopsis sp. BJA-103]